MNIPQMTQGFKEIPRTSGFCKPVTAIIPIRARPGPRAIIEYGPFFSLVGEYRGMIVKQVMTVVIHLMVWGALRASGNF